MLCLHHATVVKGAQKRILDDISLQIPEGEHTAILGPNGSGKSSLIKLITRQHYPILNEDEIPPIQIYGRERWNLYDLRQLLGIVSADLYHSIEQSSHFAVLSGLDAVISGFFSSYSYFPYNQVTAQMRTQAYAALELMQASHLAERYVEEFSTGEARRILIARALVCDPGALLLDEPTTGLDLVARHHFLEAIRSIVQHGKTLLFVTHHIEEIVPEIERVVLLKEGRVFCDGPKSEVLTSERLSELFDAPIQLTASASGYFSTSMGGM